RWVVERSRARTGSPAGTMPVRQALVWCGGGSGALVMDMDRLRRGFEPLFRGMLHLVWGVLRGLTVGGRGIGVGRDGKVFLVKHSYVTGWHLPGGGVEPGETLVDALRRELAEEGNITVDGATALHGMFFNERASRRDHIAVFVVRTFRQESAPRPNR